MMQSWPGLSLLSLTSSQNDHKEKLLGKKITMELKWMRGRKEKINLSVNH